PLIGICSLEGYIPEQDGSFVSWIDARIGGAYVLFQKKEGHRITPLGPPQFVSNENLKNIFQRYPLQAGPFTSYPDPAYLAQLAHHRFLCGDFAFDLTPLYLRTPEYQRTFCP